MMNNKNESVADSKPQLWTRNFILIIFTSMGAFMGFQMLMPTLPMLAKHLNGTDADVGMVVAMFPIAALIIRPFIGNTVDRFGRWGILLMGLTAFGLSILSYNLAATVAMLLIVRFIHGLAWGVVGTASGTLATDIIPRSRFAEGMGFYSLASTVSIAIAPAVGLWLINEYSFGMMFNIAAAFSIMSLITGMLIKAPHVQLKKQKKMVIIEKTALMPSIVIFFFNMSYGAIVTFIALYAKTKGIDNIGIYFTVHAAVLLFTRPFAGRLADRIGFDRLVLPGVVFMAGGMLSLAFAQSLWMFLLSAVLYGIGFGITMPCLQTLAVIFTPPERRGSANGTFFTGFDLGIGFSAMFWGVVAGITGYSMMFALNLIMLVIGLWIYWTKCNRKIPQAQS